MTEPAMIVYDGDCVFCRNYVQLLRLRETIGPVELVDARSGDDRVSQYARAGYDLDHGMLFVWRDAVYHGSDAVHVLRGLSGRSTLFNRLNKAIFSNRTASKWLYPFLKLGRRAALELQRKSLIGRLGD